MTDSIEKIVQEMEHAASYDLATEVERAVLRRYINRLRALSPAGGGITVHQIRLVGNNGSWLDTTKEGYDEVEGDDHYLRRVLYTHPSAALAPAGDDIENAARYRFLRDVVWHPSAAWQERLLMEPAQHLDAAIDEALRAWEVVEVNHGNGWVESK